MKAHFPSDYMAALMTADSGDTDRIAEHVAECERIGVRVLPPDVNESYETFTVIAEGMIRFGLSSIKNFGAASAQALIDERNKGGRFSSMSDFLTRIPQTHINRRALEALIKSGSFDAFGNRGLLLANIEKLLAFSKDSSSGPENQHSLFEVGSLASTEVALSPAPEASSEEMLAWEKELLGIYVSGHPLDRFKAVLANYKGSVKNAKAEDRAGYPLEVAGVVEAVKSILTKRGERMGFITIADKDASMEAVVFPEVFKKNHDALTVGTCVLIRGKLSKRNGQNSILIEKLKALD
jgi:DNA polymerase-3 subunit alpha